MFAPFYSFQLQIVAVEIRIERVADNNERYQNKYHLM